MDQIRDFREKANIFLFSSKVRMLSLFRGTGLLVSLAAFTLIILYYGFPVTDEQVDLIFKLIQASFGFYILHFWVRFTYDFHPKEFLKKNWLEFTMICILMIEGVSKNFFDFLLLEKIAQAFGMPSITDFSFIFAQVYLFITATVDISRKSFLNSVNFKVHPSYLFISTFFLIIAIGSGLLMLPEMTTMEGSMPFIDAFFTSTSATCVTGLAVNDVSQYFTFKGHFVILMLIKLGGLNIIAFGTFMVLFSKFGFSAKHHEVIEDFVNKDSLLSSKGLLGKIVLISIGLEIIGAVIFYNLWNPEIVFESSGDKIFHSIFHSVSSFNNAGLSTFSNGFYNEYVKHSYLIHLISAVLIFFGSIGFTTLLEMVEPKQLRERMSYPWKQLSTGSKISLYTSIGLIVGGGILFYFLENSKAMDGMNTIEKTITSLFSSITRTAGFNTVDYSQLALPTIVLTIVLMFIGASSSSTGGGIKTSSFFLISASTIATITGRKNIEFNKRTIPNDLVYKAFSVLMYTIFMILVSTFILTITEAEAIEAGKMDILSIFFEEVSAFSTCGLSMGATPHFSDAGKWVLVASMFIGRIGTLTVAYALTSNKSNLNYKYPNVHLMVG